MAPSLVLSLLFATFSMLAYGIVDFVIAILARRSESTRLILWSSIILVIMLLPGLLFFQAPKISAFELGLALFGAVSAVVALSAFYEGLRIGKLSVVVPIGNAWSIITVIAGVFLLNEALNTPQLIGVVLAILGTVVVSFKLHDVVRLRFNKIVLGGEYALVSMLGFGILFAVMGYLAGLLGWYWSALITMSIGAAVRLLFSLFRKTKLSFPIEVAPTLLLGSILGALALIAYNISSAYGYIAISGPIAASSPFITLMLGVILLKEKPERNQLLGILMIIAGIVLMAY
ncbi:MAG: DMT family transporter [Candidatus Micrarchaeota archaeon]|nr:DMT family transporter [Candidatus Micrarchaeota archaeon]